MKILIVYDSIYGNTRKIAEAIGKGFLPQQAVVFHVSQCTPAHLSNLDLLVAGTPTHGGRPSKAMKAFLDGTGLLSGVKAAAFDTSIPIKGQNFFMRLVIRVLGYAAKYLGRTLTKKGALVTGYESFFVSGKEGPLLEGELLRAEAWGATLLNP